MSAMPGLAEQWRSYGGRGAVACWVGRSAMVVGVVIGVVVAGAVLLAAVGLSAWLIHLVL